MGLVRDVYDAIDTTGLALVGDVFTNITPFLGPLTATMGILGIVLIAYQQMMGGKTMYKEYVFWALRYGIVVFTFFTWAYFQPIYNALNDVQESFSGAVISAAAGTPGSTPDAMDTYIKLIMETANKLFKTKVRRLKHIPKAIKIFFLGILVLIVGGFYAGVCVVITVVAKVGFIAAMCLAPVALTLLLTPATSSYFRSWCNFTIGFVIIPILSATLMAIAIATAGVVNTGSTDFSDVIQFLLLIVGLTFMTMMLPQMASSLANSSVAAVGGAAAAGAIMAAGRAPGRALTGAIMAKQIMSDASSKSGSAAASRSTTAGAMVAGGGAFMTSIASSMLQSSGARQRRLETSLDEGRGGIAAQTGGFKAAYRGSNRTPMAGGGPGMVGHQLTPEQMNRRT